jgi:hypothetical protein
MCLAINEAGGPRGVDAAKKINCRKGHAASTLFWRITTIRRNPHAEHHSARLWHHGAGESVHGSDHGSASCRGSRFPAET